KLDPPEVLVTKDLPLGDAVKKILGQPGTRVKLTVQREGKDEPMEVEITRGEVQVESVLGTNRKGDDTWEYWVDADKKIGYIRLTQFSRNSFRDMEKVVKELKDAGMKAFVLDLRF